MTHEPNSSLSWWLKLAPIWKGERGREVWGEGGRGEGGGGVDELSTDLEGWGVDSYPIWDIHLTLVAMETVVCI